MKFSIIIPVYNTEKYLEECIDSVLKQTYSDFEIICVNDASTDNSLAILERYCREDDRVILINESTNSGTSKARKDGVLKSKGEYILFLDSDDCLMQDACEKLNQLVQVKDVDIIHFNMQVQGDSEADEMCVEQMRRYVKPLIGEQDIERVRKITFKDDKLSHTLCGKLYNGDMCRRAFSYISDERFVMTEDLYAFFVITYLSNSYIGIEDALYLYNYGIGITSDNRTVLEIFGRLCSRMRIAEACRTVAVEVGGKATEYTNDINRWLMDACFCYLVGHWSELEPKTTAIVEILCQNLTKEQMESIIIRLLSRLQSKDRTSQEKKWLVPYEKIAKNSRIVLYGAGRVGQDYYEQLLQTGYCEVVAWLDQNPKSDLDYGTEIISPEKINEYTYDKILIAIREAKIQEDIKKNLIALGVKEECIIC